MCQVDWFIELCIICTSYKCVLWGGGGGGGGYQFGEVFPIFHNVDDTWALQSWKIDINWFTLFQLNSLTKESCHWSTTLFSRYQVGNNFEDLRASFWASQGLADTAGLSRTHLTFLECTDSCCWSDLRSFQGQQSSCCWRLVNLFTGVELQARDRVDS